MANISRLINPRILNIPNGISLSRILVAPFAFWFVATGQFELAVILILTAGITDRLDGYWAKRFGCVTLMGKLLDPAADKIFIDAVLIAMAWKGLLDFSWLPYSAFSIVAVTILYDIYTTRLRLPDFLRAIDPKSKNDYEEAESRLSTSFAGKLKTAIQFVAILALILSTKIEENSLLILSGQMLISATVILILFNAWHYRKQVVENDKKS